MNIGQARALLQTIYDYYLALLQLTQHYQQYLTVPAKSLHFDIDFETLLEYFVLYVDILILM